MAWLFAQLWLLLVVAFLFGALVAWTVATIALPHVNDPELDRGR